MSGHRMTHRRLPRMGALRLRLLTGAALVIGAPLSAPGLAYAAQAQRARVGLQDAVLSIPERTATELSARTASRVAVVTTGASVLTSRVSAPATGCIAYSPRSSRPHRLRRGVCP